jgi:hypothetical protein
MVWHGSFSLFHESTQSNSHGTHACLARLDGASRFLLETTVHKLDIRKRIFSRGERLLYYIERHVSHRRCLMSGFCHTTGQSVVSACVLLACCVPGPARQHCTRGGDLCEQVFPEGNYCIDGGERSSRQLILALKAN